MLRNILLGILALFFILAGANHFRAPDFYLPMMPPWLPWHMALIYLSGLAEILGGIGILLPRTRRLAGWGLILLLVAVFPANIHAALNGFHDLSPLTLWLRLPFQALFIAGVYWTCLSCPSSSSSAS